MFLAVDDHIQYF